MNGVFILYSMIFLAIVDDFYLQPIILSKLKQRDWWKENAPQKMYKDDYITATCIHAFSWTFMMMMPLCYINNFNMTPDMVMIFSINMMVHGIIDNTKANYKFISFSVDQALHVVQIVVTFLLVFKA